MINTHNYIFLAVLNHITNAANQIKPYYDARYSTRKDEENEEKSIACHISDPPNEVVTFTVISPKVRGTTKNSCAKIKN